MVGTLDAAPYTNLKIGRTIERNFQVNVKGLSGDLAYATSEAILKVVNTFERLGGVAMAVERYYVDMGLILSTTKDVQAYVDIPFTPETTPQCLA